MARHLRYGWEQIAILFNVQVVNGVIREVKTGQGLP